nr:hypothetical protein [Haloprofundus salilacus]
MDSVSRQVRASRLRQLDGQEVRGVGDAGSEHTDVGDGGERLPRYTRL